MCYNLLMTKNVVISGELAEQARRLTGASTARAAAEAAVREFIRRRESARGECPPDEAENENARKERIARQHRRLLDGAFAIARQGSPFYPGFNHKKLRKNRDFG